MNNANFNSLWGDAVTVPSSTEELNGIKDKLTTSKKAVSKSANKKLSLPEMLAQITQEVHRILGRYVNQTVCIRDRNTLHAYIDTAIENGIISIDTETNNSLDPLTCKIMGLCLYTPNEKNAYIPINHVNNVLLTRLENQLTEKDIEEELKRLNETKTILHNSDFDFQVIHYTCNTDINVYWDTMIGARLLNENEPAKLKTQYHTHIDPTQDKYDIEHLFKGLPYEVIPPELFALYAATDAYLTYRLYEYQLKEFSKPDNKRIYELFRNVEMPILRVVSDMEMTGIALDEEFAKRLSLKYHNKLETADKEIYQELQKYSDTINKWKLSKEAQELVGKKTKAQQLSDPISINSPVQLAILLYDILKVPVKDKKNPRGTGEEILTLLTDYPICKAILNKRGIEKLIGTYIDKLPKCRSTRDNRIHARFNSLGADTGRMSSTDPKPSVNWGRKIRLIQGKRTA